MGMFASLSDSIATAYPHSFTFVGLDYGWGKRIGNNQTVQSIVGGSFNADVQPAYYNYGLFGFFGYYATFGAGIGYKGIYQVAERHQVTGQIEIPVAS